MLQARVSTDRSAMLQARVSTDKEVCHATSKDYKYMYFYNLCYNQ